MKGEVRVPRREGRVTPKMMRPARAMAPSLIIRRRSGIRASIVVVKVVVVVVGCDGEGPEGRSCPSLGSHQGGGFDEEMDGKGNTGERERSIKEHSGKG